jgi:DNA invertase Pin-like site-specific DNA recombinase
MIYRTLTEVSLHEREEIKTLNKDCIRRQIICKQYGISPSTFYEITRQNRDVY